MSLFGGNAVYEPETSPFPASSALASPVASSPPARQIPEEAQNLHAVSYATYDADDDAESDSDESDVGLNAAYDSSRPNRFVGKRTTWQAYTATERGIAASMDEIQASDLAAHLYNADALRQHVRLPSADLAGLKSWQSKDLWLKKGADLRFTDITGEEQTNLVPFKRWTAWPLPADEVPSVGERSRRLNGTHIEEMTAGSGAQEAGDDLKEEILALLLRQAKERYLGRGSAEVGSKKGVEPPNARSRSRSKSVISERTSRAASNVNDSDNEGQKTDGEAVSASERKWTHILKAEKRTRRQRPTVLADDEYARRVLQPPINSLLAHVDRLAAGVRRSRLNHFGKGGNSDTSGSEPPSDVDSNGSSSRSPSRSRSRSASAKTPTSRISSRAPSVQRQKHARPSKASKGNRKRQRPLDENDSASDHSLEFGPESGSASEPSKRSASRRKITPSRDERESSIASSSSGTGEASVQVGLMDWSEILGVASITGWNEKALARTAQRCAALFGEGMTFRPFEESLANKPVAEPIPYTPENIPAPDIQDVRSTVVKRPFFEVGTLRCPHTDCEYHKENLRIPYRVIEHVKRMHGYDPRTNDSDNEERKHGGVHKDGFLQTITAKQGWLGGGRSKSNTPAPIRSKSYSTGARQPRVEKSVTDEALENKVALHNSVPSSPA